MANGGGIVTEPLHADGLIAALRDLAEGRIGDPDEAARRIAAGLGPVVACATDAVGDEIPDDDPGERFRQRLNGTLRRVVSELEAIERETRPT